jgi:DNA-binding GntR family transcriptional regulator
MSSTTSSRAVFVHDLVRSDIVSGALRPGEPLRLAALSTKYDVSMSVVREALTRLAEHNLATLSPNQGFRVVDISREDLIELTELRINLEGVALVKSIELGDVQWEASVVSAHHVLERATMGRADGFGSTDEWSEAHSAFHDALVSACNSPRLLTLTRSLRNSAELYRQLSAIGQVETGRDLAAEHLNLMELATTRHAAEACDALARHIGTTTEVVLATALAESI